MYDLKTAIVSGASSAIGAAICKSLSESYNIIALYRDKEKYDSFCGDANYHSFCVHLDLEDNLDDIFDSLEEKNITFPSVLVNNAGMSINGMCEKFALDDYAKIMYTNVLGTFLLTKAAIPYMKEQKWGRIINISSITATTGAFGASAYSASKGAINSFTKSVAKEVGKYNITANSVSLGYINTGLIRDVPQYVVSDIVTHTPLNRLGRADEVANVVGFLASESSSFITGAVIPVTGGYV
jgi:3-oxoacyl-[acyl-carrier protein] reductase